MDTDERNILAALIKMSEQTNERIQKFTKYLITVFITLIVTSSILICIVVCSNNATLKECTRLYFETDYSIGEVSQTIGDVSR